MSTSNELYHHYYQDIENTVNTLLCILDYHLIE